MQASAIIDQPSRTRKTSAPSANVRPHKARKSNVGQHVRAHSSARLARRDRVVLEHLPLVKAIAVNMRGSLPAHVDLDDLVHAGILGLLAAASRYNPNQEVSFPGYAKHRIK